ncbi:MAG TPA: DUF5996 family protein [Longimicrobiales bacterium]|nr:DUF5996 family protein [Longimicrobiales bacterium]
MIALPYHDWRPTLETLHMWTQVVGKIQLALAPPVNHWWHIAQHVTARGLTTGPLPHGDRTFEIDLDFVEHDCRIVVSDGDLAHVPLQPMAVAEFHGRLLGELDERGLHVDFWRQPVEITDPIPFDVDRVHRSYDAARVTRFFQALSGADRILRRFRGEFLGKSSPVHFFWGSFDLAVTRFSGREAPPHPGGIPNLADWVTRSAYSHEVFSAGWWPGSEAYPKPAFYAYAYPEPDGFGEAQVPSGAHYHPDLREFVLPWPESGGADPDAVLDFLRAAWSAAADLGGWNRQELEPK